MQRGPDCLSGSQTTAGLVSLDAFARSKDATPSPPRSSHFHPWWCTPPVLLGCLAPKRRFSELAGEASCNQEDACALKQRLDDEAKPVIAQGQALVLQHPSVAALDRPAPLAQSRSGWLATLVDLGRDPEEAAQIAMMLGVIAFVREHRPDPGHDRVSGQ